MPPRVILGLIVLVAVMLGSPVTLEEAVMVWLLPMPVVSRGIVVVEVTVGPDMDSVGAMVAAGVASMVTPYWAQRVTWYVWAAEASDSPHWETILECRVPVKAVSRQTQAMSVPQGVLLIWARTMVCCVAS
jgi:hypothetical protein